MEKSIIKSNNGDDRAFCTGLLCYYLAQLRRNTTVTKPKEAPKFDWSSLSRSPSIVSAVS